MTITELSVQDTCPDFCELTEHNNMNTADAPVIIHRTEDHIVHGVRVGVAVAADGEGAEVEDDALSVWIDDRQCSLSEAWDIGMAILAAVSQAELSDPYVRRCLDERGPSTSARIGRIFREENHEKHVGLRATRGEATT